MPIPHPGTVRPVAGAAQQEDQAPETLRQPDMGGQQETPPPLPGAGNIPPPPALNPAFQQQSPPVIPGSSVPPAPATNEELIQAQAAAPQPVAQPWEGQPLPSIPPGEPAPPVASEVPPIPQQPVTQEDSPSMPFAQPEAPTHDVRAIPQPMQPTYAPPVQPAPLQPAYAPVAQPGYPPPSQQALTPAPAGGALQTGVSSGDVVQQLEQAGFIGLELGFGSFPTVRLQGESFSTSDGGSLGQTFACIIHSARPKYLLKCADVQNADEFVYSYDRKTTTGGKSIDQLVNIWKEKGWDSPVWKDYLDVTAQLVGVEQRELGEVVMLSIPNSGDIAPQRSIRKKALRKKPGMAASILKYPISFLL